MRGSRNPSQTLPPHQTGHTMFPTAFALHAQHLPDLRTPIDAITIRMDGADGGCPSLTFLHPVVRRAALPGILPTRRNVEQATHQTEGNHGATTLDHGLPYREVLAKNAAASFKKSRSRVARANSRLRGASS